ncbi:MAG: AFG1 family ATPase [Gammaproteobacteria bacterium]|nr:AFG1 family ATPase [Gammaproteobacteria bacterium]
MYNQAIASGELEPDPVQKRVVGALERVFQELVAAPQTRRPPAPASFWKRLSARWAPEPTGIEVVLGLYLWGGVGRGKTHLMNAFFDALPFEQKERIHFHRFMQRIHDELKTLRDREDPLALVAARLAGEFRVLCLDEFHVSDIADAMILSRLLENLFEHGVTLITTSNVPPDDLYKNGLQRVRFLPAIELLKANTEVMHVDGVLDYRLRTLEKAEIYLHPLGAMTDGRLAELFDELIPENTRTGGTVEIQNREITCERVADGIVWFAFDELCGGPRGTADYIEIARYFHTVFLSGIPIIEVGENDRAIRFISLVDEFYDRNVNLIVSAAAPPEALYRAGRHQFEYERTVSRLLEMQSREYLALKHLP